MILYTRTCASPCSMVPRTVSSWLTHGYCGHSLLKCGSSNITRAACGVLPAEPPARCRGPAGSAPPAATAAESAAREAAAMRP